MRTRNTLSALIGLWFLIAPWVLGFDSPGALWTSVVFGAVQIISSLWATDKSGWGVWQNWVSLVAGVWFILLPFAYSLSSGETWSSVILGLITVLLNLQNLATKS
ncbi:SPW repeat protein [Paenibacillus sp. P26]|nr:SPW repeat protein [Paenibacillus sp. P26]UUZ92737.1 SPW repeat protein [Paenibacillus sp. P25]